MKGFIVDPDGSVHVAGYGIEEKEYKFCLRAIDNITMDFLINHFAVIKEEIAARLVTGGIGDKEISEKIAGEIFRNYLFEVLNFNQSLYSDKWKRKKGGYK